MLGSPRLEPLEHHREPSGAAGSTATELGTLRHRLAEVGRDVSWCGPGFLADAQRVLATPYATRKAVALLPYTDVAKAQRWLGDVFRLAPGPTEENTDGTIRYASVITGQGLIHLHQAIDDFQPPAVTGVCTAMIVVSVDDVDQLAEHVASQGARITHGPANMGYGVRELGASDLAGHVWCFHQTHQVTGEQT